MLTRKRFMKLLILLMALSLIIAACDRPLPNNNENDSNSNENTGYPVASPVGAGEVGGNTATDPGAGEAEVPAEADGEPTEGETGGGEGEPSEVEVPAEADGEPTGGEESPPAEGGEGEGSGEPGEVEVPAEATPEASEGSEGGEGEGQPSEAEVPAEASEGATAEGEGEPGAAEVPAESVPGALPATHTVAAGENLYRIGLQYGMSWVVIAQANGITNPDRIYAGQVLTIPGGSGEPGGGGQPPPMPTPEGINYVVKPGDTLYKIAQRFKISWTEIAEANGLVNPNEIYAGQVLKIPVDGPPQTVHHLVKPGETLFRISLHYGVSWLAIANANRISAPYHIYAGQTLIIPGGH